MLENSSLYPAFFRASLLESTLNRASNFWFLFFLVKRDSSRRSGGNVGNALFAFSKEEGNPRSWFLGISLFRHFHRSLDFGESRLLVLTIIATAIHPQILL